MVTHYEVHVIFGGIEHQLQENVLHHFLHYNSLEILYKIEKFLLSIQAYSLETFATLTYHINDLHPNI